jgi:hypothetical protein
MSRSDLLMTLRAQGDPAQVLEALSGLEVYPLSLSLEQGVLYFMGRRGTHKKLGVLGSTLPPDFGLEQSHVRLGGQMLWLGLGETDHANAVALRAHVPFTAPGLVGLRTSAGLGDRLGIATPGHVRAMRHSHNLVPILAQQSIREMERTARTPEMVMDDAAWGVLQEGWREGYGADADHLKTKRDVDVCVAAGFVLYTFDPRDQVDDAAETDDLATLRAKFAALPWEALATSPEATRQAYLGKTWELGGLTLRMDEEHLLRGACKYGLGLAHIAELYRHLEARMAGRPYEVEVSVDETETPTRIEEHLYIATELKRLGVRWTALAPRYVGRFEKGVDYIGDLDEFACTFAEHMALARALGPYKLSLHSGSDKFSIYPIAAQLAGELVHLKTAGTSYLEALRAIAGIDPSLFREIYQFAIEHYETDRASYHVSAELAKMPAPASVADTDLAGLLDQFDARQAFHVTFGTVLTTRKADGSTLFRDRLYAALEGDEEAHYAALEEHITRHVLPFSH